MFPHPESRFKTAFRRSLDAAIDFATLGEYGYAPAWDDVGADGEADGDWGFDGAWASSGGAATAVATATRPRSATATAALVPPATAAARALRNAERRSEPVCAGQPTRARALAAQLPRTARHRDGMAPREQHCEADAAA